MNPYLNLKPLSATYGVTVNGTVTSLPSIPTNAAKALIQVTAQDINARFDATTSVTSGANGGLTLFVNTIAKPYYEIEGWETLYRMRMVMNGLTASKINVVYFGEGQPT